MTAPPAASRGRASGSDDDRARTDRAAAVRAALRRLVAERGFHGTSMSAVAEAAGVAAGTAYVHYRSKDELVIAAYLEVKHELGVAAAAAVGEGDEPDEAFRAMWLAIHSHLTRHRDHARFLVQVDASPYAEVARARALDGIDDPLVQVIQSTSILDRLVPLPLAVLYDLSIAPAVRLAASDLVLSGEELARLAGCCWRAVAEPARR